MLSAAGTLQKHKFENCMTIDRQSWGYRRNAVYASYLSVHEIIVQLVQTVRFLAFYSFQILHIVCYSILSYFYSVYRVSKL